MNTEISPETKFTILFCISALHLTIMESNLRWDEEDVAQISSKVKIMESGRSDAKSRLKWNSSIQPKFGGIRTSSQKWKPIDL